MLHKNKLQIILPIIILIYSSYTLINILLSSTLFPVASDKVYCLTIAWLLAITSIKFNIDDSEIHPIHNKLQILCFSLMLLLSLYAFSMQMPSSHGAILTTWFAQIFFISRPISVAAGFIAAFCLWHAASQTEVLRKWASRGHWWALLAGTVFLTGEISGSYWAFVGWGRTWSWSSNFYFSALTYLLWILVFHLPKSWLGREQNLRRAQSMILAGTSLFNLGYSLC